MVNWRGKLIIDEELWMLKELMLVFKEIELMIDFVDLDYILIKFVKLFDVDLGINFFIVILERFK